MIGIISGFGLRFQRGLVLSLLGPGKADMPDAEQISYGDVCSPSVKGRKNRVHLELPDVPKGLKISWCWVTRLWVLSAFVWVHVASMAPLARFECGHLVDLLFILEVKCLLSFRNLKAQLVPISLVFKFAPRMHRGGWTFETIWDEQSVETGGNDSLVGGWKDLLCVII